MLLLFPPRAPERGHSKPRKHQRERQSNPKPTVRQMPGNHLRVLAHERKTANDGKAKENESRDLEKQKVKNSGYGSYERAGAAHEAERKAFPFTTTQNPNSGSKAGTCGTNRTTRVAYAVCHRTILAIAPSKAPAQTAPHRSLFRGIIRVSGNSAGL